MSKRPVLIFDFGNVVAHFDFTLSCERFGRPLGLSGADFLAKARAQGFVEVLKVYERGGMSSADFHRQLCNVTGAVVGYDEFATGWGDIFTPNESVHRLILDLKKRGYRLFLGSNTNELHALHFRRQFETLLDQFDGLVLSYEVSHLKPDAGFYLACVEAAGQPANECVFIDDVLENVEGAKQTGLIGLHYRDTAGLIDDLARIGVQVSDTLLVPETINPTAVG